MEDQKAELTMQSWFIVDFFPRELELTDKFIQGYITKCCDGFSILNLIHLTKCSAVEKFLQYPLRKIIVI